VQMLMHSETLWTVSKVFNSAKLFKFGQIDMVRYSLKSYWSLYYGSPKAHRMSLSSRI
jgi:hypothetical protein